MDTSHKSYTVTKQAHIIRAKYSQFRYVCDVVLCIYPFRTAINKCPASASCLFSKDLFMERKGGKVGRAYRHGARGVA